MPTYSLSTKLPSCTVNRKLLEDVENYILTYCASRVEKSQATKYEFVLSDSTGVETLQRVSEFQYHVFPNDTRRIHLEATASNWTDLGSPKSITLKIQFDVDSDFSELNMQLTGPNARENAHGALAAIQRILEPFRNWHHFFHNSAVAVTSFMLLVVLVVVTTVLAGLVEPTSGQSRFPPEVVRQVNHWLTLCWFVMVLGALLFFSLRRICPYTVFETRLNERRKGQVRWLISGVGASLAATVLYETLRTL